MLAAVTILLPAYFVLGFGFGESIGQGSIGQGSIGRAVACVTSEQMAIWRTSFGSSINAACGDGYSVSAIWSVMNVR